MSLVCQVILGPLKCGKKVYFQALLPCIVPACTASLWGWDLSPKNMELVTEYYKIMNKIADIFKTKKINVILRLLKRTI